MLALAVNMVVSALVLIRVDRDDPSGESARSFRRKALPVVLGAAAVFLVCAVGFFLTSEG